MADDEQNLGDAVVDQKTDQGFTPGPWVIDWVRWPEQEPIGFAIRSDDAETITSKRGVSIVSINCSQPNIYPAAVYSSEELQYNARLIAAAPTLYKSLTRLLKTETNLNGCSGVELLDAVDEARAALALVDGPHRNREPR